MRVLRGPGYIVARGVVISGGGAQPGYDGERREDAGLPMDCKIFHLMKMYYQNAVFANIA